MFSFLLCECQLHYGRFCTFTIYICSSDVLTPFFLHWFSSYWKLSYLHCKHLSTNAFLYSPPPRKNIIVIAEASATSAQKQTIRSILFSGLGNNATAPVSPQLCGQSRIMISSICSGVRESGDVGYVQHNVSPDISCVFRLLTPLKFDHPNVRVRIPSVAVKVGFLDGAVPQLLKFRSQCIVKLIITNI